MDLDVLPIQPYGIHTAQTWGQIAAYFDMIDRWGIQQFIEIGVDKGGLAAMMVGMCFVRPNFQYVGVELLERRVDSYVADRDLPNAVIITGNCFEPKIFDTIATLIRNAHGTLLLCDGGNKAKEIYAFQALMKSGDLITVHDWGVEFKETDIPWQLEQRYQRITNYEDVGLPVWRKR
jgi:cephalosporin hydroxylase